MKICKKIICTIFVISNYILYYGLLHHYTVESYTLNPKAIHPNGRIPTSIAKARRMTSIIKQEIEKNINDENSIICFVDGNNIRNSFGYENMSALQLTELLSSWTIHSSSGDDIRPQILCFWDGGTICQCQDVALKTHLVHKMNQRNKRM